MPDESQWTELEGILKQHPSAVMVWEDVPMKEIKSKLRSMGVKFAVFNPCGNRPGEGDFISTMNVNLESLRKLY
jgi:zinc transport system substrate-binding protein